MATALPRKRRKRRRASISAAASSSTALLLLLLGRREPTSMISGAGRSVRRSRSKFRRPSSPLFNHSSSSSFSSFVSLSNRRQGGKAKAFFNRSSFCLSLCISLSPFMSVGVSLFPFGRVCRSLFPFGPVCLSVSLFFCSNVRLNLHFRLFHSRQQNQISSG